ncbi:MAG: TIGR03960 family B12-binding radical SAM protein [Clostridiales bacterium]|nr:TIGR03960 family B12-binding radical SAM protein [Clostridiales bacterium]
MELVKPYLQEVEKPQRYLGEELHQVKKDWESVQCRFLFGFPDVYEVGMSCLGLSVLYEAVNRRPGLLMERAFSPWRDMEALMNREGIPLYGWESGRPAGDFDCIGFTLQHEMSYTNVLQMLKLSGVPLLAAERGGDTPLIIGGGPCLANAEPMALFFDALVLGEGEEALPDLLEIVGAHKAKRQGRMDRAALFAELAALPGVYIPSGERGSVRKACLPDLEDAPFPLEPIVPYMEIIHDRMMLEILRGCTRGCRFCQAGMIYRPVRERHKDTLLAQAGMLRDTTGHREISLTSLSSSDHTCIKELIEELTAKFSVDRISVSLPSLRANHFSVDLAREIQKVRKTGLTFAPEAGSQRLRDAINKGLDEEAFLSTVEKAAAAGWQQMKLYFMIGLPGETLEDVDAIAELCEKAVLAGSRVLKEQGVNGGMRVSCAVSNFVPKAQTPFQWTGQASQDELREKHNRLRQRIKNRRISLSYHDAFTSMLEAIFARGGRELTPVLLAALEKGCRFDSWTEELRKDSWKEAFAEAGMDMEALATADFALDAPLPWDHLDYGVTKAFLRQEYEKSLRAETTGDCRYTTCAGCGVCDMGSGSNVGSGSSGSSVGDSSGDAKDAGLRNRLSGEAVDF